MKYNIKLNIKAIIRTEQLLSKPFAEIDYTNPDELLKLLYCAVLVGNDVTFTFDEFCEITENQKLPSQMIREIGKYNEVLAQFTKSAESMAAGSDGRPPYMKELAGMLVMSGLDAGYVLNEMELSDIPVFAAAIEKKKREDMEAARLWMFLSVAPHIDTKRIGTAEDYFPFPWEIERQRKEAQEATLRDYEMAERFFQEGMNIFKN